MTNQASKSTTKDTIKIWLKENFSKKNNLTRLVCFLIAAIVVLVPATIMNVWAQAQTVIMPFGKTPFIYINLVLNSGAGFSLFANSDPWVVYFIQSLMCFIVICVFLSARQKALLILLSLGIVGALFNIFDRASSKTLEWDIAQQTNVVIDYFTFSFFGFPTFNFPDVFIVIGLIGAAGYYFIHTLFVMTRDSKKLNKQADAVTKKAKKIKRLQKSIKIVSPTEVKIQKEKAIARRKQIVSETLAKPKKKSSAKNKHKAKKK